MSEFLTNLDKYGYAKINNVFNEHEKKILKEYSELILQEQKISYEDLPSTIINDEVELYYNKKNVFTFFKTLNRNFLGCYEELDKLFSNLLSKKSLEEYLKQILGEDYKLHTCLLRKADKDSNYMGLHADNNFAFTISVLCDDLQKDHPTTVFVPRSHKFNYNFKNRIERLNPKNFSYLTEPSIGKTGDINCFFNKTLHGIKKCSKNKNFSNTIWLLGFHRNSDKIMRTILLPDYTNYGKKIEEVFPQNILKLFELNPNSRKIEKISIRNNLLDKINDKHKNSISVNLKLIFFKIVEFNISFIRKVIFHPKFLFKKK